MKVKVKKLDPNARLPTYGTEGAACFDLYCLSSAPAEGGGVIYRTGLSFEIPEGHALMVYSRSGMGFERNIKLANSVGVIDSDYRGEVMVKLTGSNIPYPEGSRIAQGMIIPYDKIDFEEVKELKESDRGEKGFGSTGT